MKIFQGLRAPARVGTVGIVLLAGACGDAGPTSGPGTLRATLVSPNGAEGAARVFLVGEGVASVSALEGRVFSFQRGDTTHVVVVHDGDSGGDLSFSVSVADTTRPPQGVVVEVSDSEDRVRGLTGYALEFRR